MSYDDLPDEWPEQLVYRISSDYPEVNTARLDYVQAPSRRDAEQYIRETHPRVIILSSRPTVPPENREIVAAAGGEQA